MNLKSLVAISLLALASMAAGEKNLTICNFASPSAGDAFSTENRENAPLIPAFKHSCTQIIYPSEMLAQMDGKQIESISFKHKPTDYVSTVWVSVSTVNDQEFIEQYDYYRFQMVDYNAADATRYEATAIDDGTFTIDLSEKPINYKAGKSLLITVISDAEYTVDMPFYATAKTSDKVYGLTYGSDETSFIDWINNEGNIWFFQQEVGSKLSQLPVAQIRYGDRIPETAFSGGKGTEAEPYLISNLADLTTLNDWTNDEKTEGIYFKLTNDITEPCTKPVGTIRDFLGSFDGDYHCVSLNMEGDQYLGLFGSVKGGSIKNLQVDGTVSGSTYVGGLAGAVMDGTVLENLVNYATIIATGSYCGGVVGTVDSQTTSCHVAHCANFGNVSGNIITGGIVGQSGRMASHEFNRCINYGQVDGSLRVGGIIGQSMGQSDKFYGMVSIGMTQSADTAPIIFKSNSALMGEFFYDTQYFNTSGLNPRQEKLTREMTGDALKGSSSSSQMTEDYWLFEDGMLPRLKMNGTERSQRAILFASPVLLADDNSLNNIDKPFSVAVGNGVEWSSENQCVAIAKEGNASLLKEGDDFLIAKLGDYSRKIPIRVTGNASVESTVGETQADVIGANGCINIVLPTAAQVAIADIAGRCIYQASLPAGAHRIAVEQGIYIVRTSNASFKIIVR